MGENEKNRLEKDDFWDLSALVPKRKSEARVFARRTSVTATEISVSPRFVRADHADVPLTERPVHPQSLKEKPPAPERVYRPQNALVREVRVYPWKNKYSYYEHFRRQARYLHNKEGKECGEVDFFSYMPQYSQLNAAQLDYYLWWRTKFRQGVCLPAAYSYVLLYLYELINLDESSISPQTGQENMLRLWLSYREKYPKLDPLVREWLCDYSLLYQLPPPRLDPKFYRELLSGCKLKEFYVPADEGDALKNAMLLFCNNYDYTKSKFYRADTKEDYDRVLGGAVAEAVAFLREESGAVLTNEAGISTVSRDVFSGAICSCYIKRRVEVDFTSFSHTHDLRYIMTDVLKYAENVLRANRGIKSRLSIYAVSVPLRERLDAYLAKVLPPRRHAVKREESVPEYERRYDLPNVELSASHASEIEADSWQTTKRLVEAFEVQEIEITPETGVKNAVFEEETPALADPPQAGSQPSLVAALGKLSAFLPLALSRDRAAQRAFAASHGLMLDAIVDKINTVAGDILGDILLEEEDGAYGVIEDYLDFLQEQGVLS